MAENVALGGKDGSSGVLRLECNWINAGIFKSLHGHEWPVPNGTWDMSAFSGDLQDSLFGALKNPECFEKAGSGFD